MGQTNLDRTEFDPCELITSSLDSTKQLLAMTSYFKVGDLVDIVAKDAKGCYVGSPLAESLSVSGVVDCEALIFDVSVDTSTALPAGANGWYAIAKAIDDGQSAVDRLYRCFAKSGNSATQICLPIVDSVSGDPAPGQTCLLVDDLDCLLAGDEYQVVAQSGILATGIVVSVDPRGDEANNRAKIVIDTEVDLTGAVDLEVCSVGLTFNDFLKRLKGDIDEIDKPCENEYMGSGNCDDIAFETAQLFLAGSSKILLDGRRLRLGTAGTRATLSQGSLNSEVTFTSMILGQNGNKVSVAVAAGAGLTVAVTGCFEDGDQLITVNDNGGAATAEEIAGAVNADAAAQKIVQAQYGGDGTGIVSPFAAALLSGGLDDGTGDYAEIPPVVNNEISLTGYKWISLWVFPTPDSSQRNRLRRVPRDSEEVVADYRKALTNA